MGKTNYTVINHIARRALGLSMNEYSVCDLIYHLSNNPASFIQGWCFASKDYLAEMVDLSRISIHSILNRLEEKKLIERDPETKHIRTTELWYNTVVITITEKQGKETLQGIKKLYTQGKETLHQGKETLHNNNINNNNYNNIDSTFGTKAPQATPNGTGKMAGKSNEQTGSNGFSPQPLDLAKAANNATQVGSNGKKIRPMSLRSKREQRAVETIKSTQTFYKEIPILQAYFLETMGIPEEDGYSNTNSLNSWKSLVRWAKKNNPNGDIVEILKKLINIAAQDDFWSQNITSSTDLYAKRTKLLTRLRIPEGKERISM